MEIYGNEFLKGWKTGSSEQIRNKNGGCPRRLLETQGWSVLLKFIALKKSHKFKPAITYLGERNRSISLRGRCEKAGTRQVMQSEWELCEELEYPVAGLPALLRLFVAILLFDLMFKLKPCLPKRNTIYFHGRGTNCGACAMAATSSV